MESQYQRVTGIIPVYNGRDKVARAIESALAQTYRLHEIIVVDDGSTDDTAEIVAKFPVKYVCQNNAGPAAARNNGASVATGDWFAFLDHDDVWRPEKTERQLQLGVDPHVGVIYCALKKIDQVPINWDNLWARNIVGTPSGTLVRRECFLEVGGFDPRRELIGTEDHHLWMRVALTKWQFARSRGALFDYVPTNQGLSSQYQRMVKAEWISCEDIGKRTTLDKKLIQVKKVAIANHYIQELIGTRDMAGARGLISQIGARQVAPKLLLAAFSPEWLLRARRNTRLLTHRMIGAFQ